MQSIENQYLSWFPMNPKRRNCYNCEFKGDKRVNSSKSDNYESDKTI